jgi:hypothetical protein
LAKIGGNNSNGEHPLAKKRGAASSHLYVDEDAETNGSLGIFWIVLPCRKQGQGQ